MGYKLNTMERVRIVKARLAKSPMDQEAAVALIRALRGANKHDNPQPLSVYQCKKAAALLRAAYVKPQRKPARERFLQAECNKMAHVVRVSRLAASLRGHFDSTPMRVESALAVLGAALKALDLHRTTGATSERR